MTVTDRPLEGIDLLAGTWGRGVPHDQFDRLRAEAPVYWHPEPGDTGFWAITKHADVRAVSHDHHTFSSELGGTFIPTQDEEALAQHAAHDPQHGPAQAQPLPAARVEGLHPADDRRARGGDRAAGRAS